ncbi:hypothetical protein [Amycolatopsis thermophila]|uniref:Uncharacterized protein n=1 Tax=Amycolatopsis thermophila TaxID=206084 RepID=A0ABU0EZD6_9PSEU|nr:hypothetical protein [Amycolatopsis thermophila]MDQ0380215.1 hypothetical protein [Amycolatopsis thermophila]
MQACGRVDPRQVRDGWAPGLHARVLSGGHFPPEERPREVTRRDAGHRLR